MKYKKKTQIVFLEVWGPIDGMEPENQFPYTRNNN